VPLITLKAQIHADPQIEAVLKDAMFCATKVYNGLLWHLRKEYKETGRVNISRKNLNRILKELPRAKGYYSMSVQLTRDEVREAYKSFFALKKKGLTQHEAPGFRRKNCLSPLKYVQSGFRVDGDRVTLSLGTGREDGVKQVSFRISHRPGIEYERVRELSIAYDKVSGQIEARLVVEVKARENKGTGKAAVDLGETILMACVFDDGTIMFYSGRLVKAVRRYWQKVRASLKQNSRRWKETAHREKKQVEHLLHVTTSHFIAECVRRGVKEIVVGNLNGIRESMDYGDRLNQRLHVWPYRKVVNMLKYKGALVEILVRDDVDEKSTSITCHACGKVMASNRRHRGLYACSCGWKAQADVNGALNIYERAYQVSPVKGSSGRVARPAAVSFLLGWHGVAEPKRGNKAPRASV
jgi:IS605 OrfB family transposase